MNVLKAVAQALGLLRSGHRPFRQGPAGRHPWGVSKESSGDVVLACLGDKQLYGASPTHGWQCASTEAAGKGRNTPSAAIGGGAGEG